jgi:hypothetical protein
MQRPSWWVSSEQTGRHQAVKHSNFVGGETRAKRSLWLWAIADVDLRPWRRQGWLLYRLPQAATPSHHAQARRPQPLQPMRSLNGLNRSASRPKRPSSRFTPCTATTSTSRRRRLLDTLGCYHRILKRSENYPWSPFHPHRCHQDRCRLSVLCKPTALSTVQHPRG